MMQVLIVDDDPQVRQMLGSFLERTGWEIKTANDFESGTELLSDEIDVLLTDIKMGEKSGIDLLRKAKERFPFIEVIMMTGYTDIQDSIEALNLRAFAYLTKPFEFSELNQTLINAASTRKLNQREAFYKKDLEKQVKDKTRQLRMEKEKLLAILNATPSLLMVVDSEQVILDSNRMFESITGENIENARGKHLCHYISGSEGTCTGPGDCSPSSPCSLNRMMFSALESPDKVIRKQLNLVVQPEGNRERKIIRASFCLLPGKIKGKQQILMMMDDITREKEMEAQLIHSGRMTALGEMASGVAHELNQPLNGIATYIQLLQSRIEHGNATPDDQLSVVYSDLLHEVERMSGIIDNLRIFHRAGSLPSANSPVDLSEVFTNAMKIARNQIGRYGIELKENFEPGLPRVMADSSRLEQLFLNLVINARDALIELDAQTDGNGGEQKTISVDCKKTTRDQTDWVKVEIRDNGPGIPQENLEKIFDPFFTTKDPDKGTGLGLAICYQSVADINGTIEVESEQGVGTVFQIWIPASGPTD